MEDAERVEQTKKTVKAHPRDRANILSVLCFCWALPYFVKGFKKDLTEDDLYGPLKVHESKPLGDSLDTAWTKEKARSKNPSLSLTLCRVYGKQIVLYVVLSLVQELVVKMGQPLLIGKLMIYYMPNQNSVTLEQAYTYAAGIIVLSLFNSMIQHWVFFGLQHVGMRVRVAVCSVIYRKALKLSKNAMAESTVGQIVNLMSNDVSRINYIVMHIQHLIVAPAQALLVVYLLYTTVDISAMAGVALLLLFIPLQLYMGKRTSFYRFRTAVRTDQRVRLMNEIVTGIQVIKMYTWEKPFAKLVEITRRSEIHEIKANAYLRAITVSFSMFLVRSAIFFCVLTYVLTGNTLQAEYVYVVTSFYNTIRQPLTVHLPRLISQLAEIRVSMQRIQRYLLSEEVIDESQDTTNLNGKAAEAMALKPLGLGIDMQDVCVKWSILPISDYTLNNITMKAHSGELVAIVGPVGSGKSTLLQVVLKEIAVSQGHLNIVGRVSYASQEPWLFSSSIRQNILFGEKMEFKKYKEVIRVCCLDADFAALPYGDRTIVGERGVMLSGGQKARVNLARAVYKNADIYLLDDPLSAVDTHVGKQLFDGCIQGYLHDKITILVTHQLQYLTTADRIYLIENGTVTASGNYQELRQSGGEFVKLLEKEPEEEEEEVKKKLKKFKSMEESEDVDLPVEIKETRSTGTLSKKVYLRYYKSGGGYILPVLVFVVFVCTQLGATGADYFLTFWVNTEQLRMANDIHNETVSTTETQNFVLSFFTSDTCLYIYSTIVAVLVAFSITRSYSFVKFCMQAAVNLHNRMFNSVVNATMRFFNTNSSGRILNRFARDMGSVDELLPLSLTDTTQLGLNILAITTVLSSVNAWLLIPTIIIFLLFFGYKTIFLATSRDLKRIESTSRSPVFGHLAQSLQGLSTIRAFGAEGILQTEFDHHQDLHSSAFYMFISCSRTFAFWLDVNCILYTAVVILSFLFIGTEMYGGNVGLAITQSINLTGMLQRGIRQWSELENEMTSVERIIEYTELPWEQDTGKKVPPPSWPSVGEIQFQSVSMRYFVDGPLVLKNLSFHVKGGEKIGIVGRTGAGKSSIVSALFRLALNEGSIIIDGIQSADISLQSLRSKISIIPQEPILFSGTLRKNLDPFEEYSDSDLWNALEEVELKEYVTDLPSGLNSKVSEGGSNYSVGQRQLVCLARAVVRSNKILVLDEATANIDPQTDELIQTTIRRKFKDCTVLTIAHRLHTVLDSDKILVMDAGKAAEFEHPHLLLQNTGGIFYGLVQQTGKAMADSLMKTAEECYSKKFGNA